MLENLVEAQMGDHLDALASCALCPVPARLMLAAADQPASSPKAQTNRWNGGWMDVNTPFTAM
jgi:hypothetical protein